MSYDASVVAKRTFSTTMYRTLFALFALGVFASAFSAPTTGDFYEEKLENLSKICDIIVLISSPDVILDDVKLPVCMTFVHKCLNACSAEENTRACNCVQRGAGSIDMKKSKCVCREDPKEYQRKLKL